MLSEKVMFAMQAHQTLIRAWRQISDYTVCKGGGKGRDTYQADCSSMTARYRHKHSAVRHDTAC